MNPNTTRVILIRHGQSTYNAQKRFQGRCDESVLTEKGCLSAYQSGIALSRQRLDAVYTSPLQRTQQTAQEIRNAIATIQGDVPKLHVHPNLQEIDLPDWQGLPYQFVREQFAADYRCWKERPHEFEMVVSPAVSEAAMLNSSKVTTLAKQSTCSPVLDLYAQAQQFWQEILSQHVGETILIVSHGGTIRALIATAIGMKCDRFHALQQSNCGISVLTFPQAEPARLEGMNLTGHLGEVLPKLKEGKHGLRLLLAPAGKAWQTQALVDLLAQVPLDFCLSSDSANAQATADFLLQSQAQPPVYLQVSQQGFFQTWHQTLDMRSRHSATLCTGLVIADEAEIISAANQLLGLFKYSSPLLLKPGALSVIHYPPSVTQPILQALNFSPLPLT